jgi:hypothetical protein
VPYNPPKENGSLKIVKEAKEVEEVGRRTNRMKGEKLKVAGDLSDDE